MRTTKTTTSAIFPETRLRDNLFGALSGLWRVTRHEEKVDFGVPDLSYVMLGGQHETGWMELKAVESAPTFKFEIRAAQHRWIEAHYRLVPVHVLCAVGNSWFLIHGIHHSELDNRFTTQELTEMSLITIEEPAYRREFMQSVLSMLTRRR